jgi:hypothetical protein
VRDGPTGNYKYHPIRPLIKTAKHSAERWRKRKKERNGNASGSLLKEKGKINKDLI